MCQAGSVFGKHSPTEEKVVLDLLLHLPVVPPQDALGAAFGLLHFILYHHAYDRCLLGWTAPADHHRSTLHAHSLSMDCGSNDLLVAMLH